MLLPTLLGAACGMFAMFVLLGYELTTAVHPERGLPPLPNAVALAVGAVLAGPFVGCGIGVCFAFRRWRRLRRGIQ